MRCDVAGKETTSRRLFLATNFSSNTLENYVMAGRITAEPTGSDRKQFCHCFHIIRWNIEVSYYEQKTSGHCELHGAQP